MTLGDTALEPDSSEFESWLLAVWACARGPQVSKFQFAPPVKRLEQQYQLPVVRAELNNACDTPSTSLEKQSIF